MTPRRWLMVRRVALLTFAVSSAARADAQQPAVPAPESPVWYSVDPQHSTIHVTTRRSGFLSFLGHDHAILAGEWDARMCADPSDPRRGHAQIAVSTASLAIDTDTARALAGMRRGPSAQQRRKLQETLLDEDHLDSGSHPLITLDVTSPVGVPDAAAAFHGRLTIRGVTRDVAVPVSVAADSGHTRIQGVLTVAQSSFGIRPESIAGVIRVADVVAIHFDLRAFPTAMPCTIDAPGETGRLARR